MKSPSYMAHNLTFIAAAAYMYNAIWTSIVSKGHAQLSFSTPPPLQSSAGVWAPTALKTLRGLEPTVDNGACFSWMLKCYLADRQRAKENHEIQADKKQYTYIQKGKGRGRQQCGIWTTRWADGFCLIFDLRSIFPATKQSARQQLSRGKCNEI